VMLWFQAWLSDPFCSKGAQPDFIRHFLCVHRMTSYQQWSVCSGYVCVCVYEKRELGGIWQRRKVHGHQHKAIWAQISSVLSTHLIAKRGASNDTGTVGFYSCDNASNFGWTTSDLAGLMYRQMQIMGYLNCFFYMNICIECTCAQIHN